jgi:hypothetical protein
MARTSGVSPGVYDLVLLMSRHGLIGVPNLTRDVRRRKAASGAQFRRTEFFGCWVRTQFHQYVLTGRAESASTPLDQTGPERIKVRWWRLIGSICSGLDMRWPE